MVVRDPFPEALVAGETEDGREIGEKPLSSHTVVPDPIPKVLVARKEDGPTIAQAKREPEISLKWFTRETQ